MTIVQRLTREPVLLLGLLTALFGVLVVFGVDLSKDQIGSITVLAGAVMAVLRFVTTPAKEVLAQQKPGEVPTAGKAAEFVPAGKPVNVTLTRLPEPG